MNQKYEIQNRPIIEQTWVSALGVLVFKFYDSFVVSFWNLLKYPFLNGFNASASREATSSAPSLAISSAPARTHASSSLGSTSPSASLR